MTAGELSATGTLEWWKQGTTSQRFDSHLISAGGDESSRTVISTENTTMVCGVEYDIAACVTGETSDEAAAQLVESMGLWLTARLEDEFVPVAAPPGVLGGLAYEDSSISDRTAHCYSWRPIPGQENRYEICLGDGGEMLRYRIELEDFETEIVAGSVDSLVAVEDMEPPYPIVALPLLN